jgi:glycosyltransferase involved in cell wall biosynthesis
LLYVVPQLPHDPASGAARSTRTICEMLAAAGFAVHALATTASESAKRFDVYGYLKSLGIQPAVERRVSKARTRPELRFCYRGVDYQLLDTGPRDHLSWEKLNGRQFDLMFDDELRSFQPDVLFAFGGLAGDARRYERARRQGVRIVFALRNDNYGKAGDFLAGMDGILTPSRFLTEFYRAVTGVDSTPLPTPMEGEDILAEDREAVFLTMINPSREKGLMFIARLAEELSVRRPDIAMLIIESRGSAGRLVEAGMLGGFDLRRHENLMMSPSMAQPKEIYAATRTLIVPSFWQEASGRVVAEAMMNGIPPLVSDRGGLAESCNGAGFTFALPPAITVSQPVPVDAEVVEPWLDAIFRLEGDEEFYRTESQRALDAASMYRPEALAPRYVEYFENLLA